jgi:SWI/SNF-related matrix-associated actin-dependent regulator of chromatin subfamily B protein 1
MPPPPSPAMAARPSPAAGATSTKASPKPPPSPSPLSQGQRRPQYYPDGHVDAPYPQPSAQQTPPPPPWLVRALEELQQEYKNDKFEATMRYSVINKESMQSVPLKEIPDGSLPATYQAIFVPRIRCLDCPGKAYTAGPDITVDNFKVHLKNQSHKGNVERRLRAGG